jgi:hypothetical protein
MRELTIAEQTQILPALSIRQRPGLRVTLFLDKYPAVIDESDPESGDAIVGLVLPSENGTGVYLACQACKDQITEADAGMCALCRRDLTEIDEYDRADWDANRPVFDDSYDEDYLRPSREDL